MAIIYKAIFDKPTIETLLSTINAEGLLFELDFIYETRRVFNYSTFRYEDKQIRIDETGIHVYAAAPLDGALDLETSKRSIEPSFRDDLEFEFPVEDAFGLVYFEKPTVRALSKISTNNTLIVYRANVRMRWRGSLQQFQTLILVPGGTPTAALFDATSTRSRIRFTVDEAVDYAIGLPCPPFWKEEWLTKEDFIRSMKVRIQFNEEVIIDRIGPRALNTIGRFGNDIFAGTGKFFFNTFNLLARGLRSVSSKK